MKKRTKVLVALFLTLIFVTGCNIKLEKKENKKTKEEIKEVKKITIIDEESNQRPYAVVINNFPKATKVQSGLQEAYIIYEFPIEGGMSRSMALYKDKTDVKIGTVRSSRQNYIDYAIENDAIYVHFGWNHPAEDKEKNLKIDYINGLFDSAPFYRENPEDLSREHTVYTDMSKIIDYATNTKNYRTTTDVKPVLTYTTDEINFEKDENAIIANNIDIPYSSSYYKVTYKYNNETKLYERYINDENHIDYFTKKQYTVKNVLVIKVDTGSIAEYKDMAGTNYLDIKNIGEGKGYYITNGYAKEITWQKSSVSDRTIYKYTDGTELEVNDGNTYIMMQSNSQELTIN